MRLLVSGCTATLRRILPNHRDVLGALVTPGGGFTSPAFVTPWAADNGAFRGLEPKKFRRMLRRCEGVPGCLFVVVPDVVADAAATQQMWGQWADDVRACGQPLAFVGQDGCRADQVPWEEIGAYFVGGSTEWKLGRESAALIAEAKRRGKWVHVGRVNSLRRLRAAYDLGADSVDGTGMSRWGDVHLAKFCRWAEQLKLQGVFSWGAG